MCTKYCCIIRMVVLKRFWSVTLRNALLLHQLMHIIIHFVADLFFYSFFLK